MLRVHNDLEAQMDIFETSAECEGREKVESLRHPNKVLFTDDKESKPSA